MTFVVFMSTLWPSISRKELNSLRLIFRRSSGLWERSNIRWSLTLQSSGTWIFGCESINCFMTPIPLYKHDKINIDYKFIITNLHERYVLVNSLKHLSILVLNVDGLGENHLPKSKLTASSADGNNFISLFRAFCTGLWCKKVPWILKTTKLNHYLVTIWSNRKSRWGRIVLAKGVISLDEQPQCV